MSKKTISILLILVIFVGSIFTFYGTNLLFSDVANLYAGFNDPNIIASFPMIMIFCDFVLAVIYLARMISRRHYRKSITKKFFKVAGAFSLIGLITAILSGVLVYHSFVKPYPFPYYCLVMIAVHSIFLILCVYCYVLVSKRMEEDPKKRKFTGGYAVYTAFLAILVWLALDRFGAFLFFPSYITWSKFYLAIPFLLTLPVLLSMVVQEFLFYYEFYRRNPKAGIIFASINLGIGFICGIVNYALYYFNSSLVASLSMPMGLERLMSSNLTTKLLLALTTFFGLAFLCYSIIYYIDYTKKEEKNND